MDLNKLSILLRAALSDTPRKLDQLAKLTPELQFTTKDLDRYLSLCALRDRSRLLVRFHQVDNHSDPMVILLAWCLAYWDRFSFHHNYERFLLYCVKHEFRAILSADRYSEYFKLPFEYCYRTVEEVESTSYRPQLHAESFVYSWLTKHYNHYPNTLYQNYLRDNGHTGVGRDDYFKFVLQRYESQALGLDKLIDSFERRGGKRSE